MNAKTDVLFTLGEPDDTKNWFDYLQYGFDSSDVSTLLALIADESLRDAETGAEVWVPVHAWRTLGQLRNPEVIQPLLDLFEFWVKDDCASTELPIVMGMIGEPAIGPLATYLQNPEHSELARIMAVAGLTEVALHYEQFRNQVVSRFQQYMAQPDCNAVGFNSVLVGSLMDLKATELIDDIRRLFDMECIDYSFVCDLEEVEIRLGLRKHRTTPRPRFYIDPFQSLEKPTTVVLTSPKIGRNEPCPCGSGKKYKKCCMISPGSQE